MNALLPSPENLVCDTLSPGRTRRILVLDDCEITRRVMALLLARTGYVVDTAEDGEAGWEAIFLQRYDLLITDNDMPRLTGLRLVERLRSVGSTLPVIIASDSLELKEADDYPALGIAAILHKPFGPDRLLATALRIAPLVFENGELVAHHPAPLGNGSNPPSSPTYDRPRATVLAPAY